MQINHAVICLDLTMEEEGRLRSALAPSICEFVSPENAVDIRRALAKADVVIASASFDTTWLEGTRVRWLHCDHSGLDRQADAALLERVLVTGSAGRSAAALAEHAIFFMLALAYDFRAIEAARARHDWGYPGQERLRALHGRTLAIAGLGHTGRQLALRAKAFDMKVNAFTRRRVDDAGAVDQLFCLDDGHTIHSVLGDCDFLVLALPLTDATFQMMGRKEFARMRPGSMLINMARGAIIDEPALVAALEEGHLGGAGLDTFAAEPLPADSPFWDMPNVYITPHFTPQLPDRMQRSLDIICDNIDRYRRELPLRNRLGPSDAFTMG
ncbi:MAG TPA: D-2-hydroxyacid dehydrogenase [Devosiaceae bacterium]